MIVNLTRIGLTVGLLVVCALIVAYAFLPSLNVRLWSPVPMPKNVPHDTVAIPFVAKSRLWAKCWAEENQNRCQIFNEAGTAVHDDVFFPYDGHGPVPTQELEIVPERSGMDYLWLKNGRILIPRTNYADHKMLVDKIIARTVR